jgi:SAM-dependent methyltransferase
MSAAVSSAPTLALHRAAAEGFTKATAAPYEKGRPEWEEAQFEAALAAVGLTSEAPGADGRFPARPVLEIGPGTGKSTRPLYAVLRRHCAPGAAPNLVGVEPTELCHSLAEELPGLVLHRGVAEDMSVIPDGSVRLVLAAQAFHWFANARALREIHRVLAPGGHLVLAWISRNGDPAVFPAVAELEALVDAAYDAVETPTPRQHTGQWRRAFDGFEGFSPIQHLPLPRAGGGHAGTEDELVAWMLSISVVARLPAEQREEVERKVREVLRRPDFPRPGGERADGKLLVPLKTDFYWVSKTE